MRSLWAAGLLLRRLGSERGIIALVFVLVTATSFVFAAAPRLFNRVSADAVRYTARAALPSQRNLTLVLESSVDPGPDGGVSGVRALGESYAKEFPPSIAALVSEQILRVTSVRLYVPDPPSYETHITLRYQDGMLDATRLTSGRWPVDRGVPLGLVEVTSGSDQPVESPLPQPVILEAALSKAAATEIGAHVGDRLAVKIDGSDPLLRGNRSEIVPTEIQVVGLYEPIDPGAEYWDGSQDLLQVTQHGTDDHPVAWATAYIPAEMYPDLWASHLLFHYEWFFRIDAGLIDADRVAQLQVDLNRLGFIAGAGQVSTPDTVVVLTGLPAILDRFAGERTQTESVLSIAAIGPFGLAGGAIAMVAILLVTRRRATLALARGRGASGSLVLGTQLWEATLLGGGAALVGLLAAVIAIPGRASPLSTVLSVAVGSAAVVLLVGASWPAARRPLGQLERDDAPVLRVTPRRLVIEGTIVFVAVAATLLLRQRGLTIGPVGNVANYDPLLASVPVLSGVAAGIVAMRLYPLPIRALAWVAAGRRGFVPVLGLRTIGRLPAAANLPLLVLMLTAAFGAFSLVITSSVDRGQVAASYQDVGADYRIERIGSGALAPSMNPGTVPGVEAVASGITDNSAPWAGAPGQRAFIYLETVDPRTYEEVTAGTDADPHWPAAFLASPSGDGIGTDKNPIPAILSPTLPVGIAHLGPGNTFRITVGTEQMTFRVVQRRASFPGIGPTASFTVVPFSWVQAASSHGRLSATVMWVRAAGAVAERLGAHVAKVQASARIVSRYDAYALLHDAPFGAAVASGYRLALGVAAIYLALTIIGALVLSAARRSRDLASLRTLGVTGRQALALTIVEHAPPVFLAVVAGVPLGIGVAILCAPGLGLSTFVGVTGDVPLYLDWPALGLMVAALVGVVATAVVAGTWLARRARLVDALRIGED